MKLLLGALGLCLLVACSAPPKPPVVNGDYRPVNRVEVRVVAPVSDATTTELN
ncbi:MAG TPA: hypothetical protein PLC34_08355 [Burkholderiaceae bacterium]|nr:hypothetical protein [Burkholderiaceae bacterium]